MKKLLILGFAVLLVAAFTLPASAFESVFGGYWRTRAFSQQQFSGLDAGPDSPKDDLSRVDTRTRIFYTAILNDNLKFVNQFEFNAIWGDTDGGDIGADGDTMRIRASFVDATMGRIRATIGIQPYQQARGFIYSDQGSGIILSTKFGEHLIPFSWLRVNEGANSGRDNNSEDIDVFAFYPVFNFSDRFSLNPFIVYAYSKDGQRGAPNRLAPFSDSDDLALDVATIGNNVFPYPEDEQDDGLGVFWLGLNADATLGSFNLWGTGIYQGGKMKSSTNSNVDVKAWLLAGGLNVPIGPASLRGQAFYATGDDDPLDDDFEAFFGIDGFGAGWSYYWAEIMGNGVFDAASSAGSPAANVSNIWAANIGVGLKPMERLSLDADLWYASLVEDNAQGNKKLGFEIDGKATYQLVEGMNIELIGAYLFADDATTSEGNDPLGEKNDKNPWEVGTRLQISF